MKGKSYCSSIYVLLCVIVRNCFKLEENSIFQVVCPLFFSYLLTFCYREIEANVIIEHLCSPLQIHRVSLEQTLSKQHGIGFAIIYP